MKRSAGVEKWFKKRWVGFFNEDLCFLSVTIHISWHEQHKKCVYQNILLEPYTPGLHPLKLVSIRTHVWKHICVNLAKG